MKLSTEFGGRILAARALGGFRLSETRYEPRTSMASHVHGNPYFCFVRRGSFQERARSRQAEHTAGAVIFHEAGEEHADRFLDAGARCFNVEVATPIVRGIATGRLADPGDLGRVRGILTALHREFSRAAPSALVLEGLAYQAVGEAFERDPARPDRRAGWLDRVRDEIHARLGEHLTLAGLAANVDVHPVHLARAFRSRFGVTITAYIRDLRVARARELLAGSSIALADVAASAGFADQSHLCRVFKRSMGVTPGEFRRGRGD